MADIGDSQKQFPAKIKLFLHDMKSNEIITNMTLTHHHINVLYVSQTYFEILSKTALKI